ncbi:hypothetical protein BZA70DRAFT_234843 [Myxozyma melibiosi]|uniref:DUF962-domain-containing protein n=1 Tax=Myxozyma melibiosi TaxID=54550 RepID=A0ABR1FF85_9ASCO
MGVLNLEDQLSFYMAYHHNEVNVRIHTICVPLILFTSFLVAANVELPISLFANSYDKYLNLGVLGSFGYTVFYILLDPYVGTAVAPIVFGSSLVVTDLLLDYGRLANIVGGTILAISWILQFIGHGVYEKRAPALLDNLVQALVLAPFFVTYEFVFKYGFRKDLENRLEARVSEKIKALDAKKSGKN